MDPFFLHSCHEDSNRRFFLKECQMIAECDAFVPSKFDSFTVDCSDIDGYIDKYESDAPSSCDLYADVENRAKKELKERIRKFPLYEGIDSDVHANDHKREHSEPACLDQLRQLGREAIYSFDDGSKYRNMCLGKNGTF